MTEDIRLGRIERLYKSVANSIFKDGNTDLGNSPVCFSHALDLNSSGTQTMKKMVLFSRFWIGLRYCCTQKTVHLCLKNGHQELNGHDEASRSRTSPSTWKWQQKKEPKYRRGVLINQGFTQKSDLVNSFKTVGLIGLNSITHMPTGSCNELFCKQKSKQLIMEKTTTPKTYDQ